MTDLASMPDEIDVQRIDPLRRSQLLEDGMSLISTNPGIDQAQAN